MKTTITFRHMDASEALKQHAKDRLKKLEKYNGDTPEAHVVLTVQSNRHAAEINFSAKQFSAVGKSETHDMYSSIDEAVSKVETTIRRSHDRLSSNRT